MVKTYELMVVARPDFPGEDEGKRQEVIGNLVGTEGVSVTSIAFFGKKRLAYPINKHTEGVYLLATISSRSLKSADIQKRSGLTNDVIRFLLIAKN